MPDIIDAFRILFLIVFVVFGNLIWYFIKSTLSENGYDVSWYRGHLGDLIDFSHLIDKTADPVKKSTYRTLLRTLIVLLLLLVVTVSSFVYDLKNMACSQYEDYLKIETSGKVVEKYRDAENRSTPTLVILFDDEEFKDINLVRMNHGLYDSLHIGDIIRKSRGDSVTFVVRGGKQMEFTVMRADYCP